MPRWFSAEHHLMCNSDVSDSCCFADTWFQKKKVAVRKDHLQKLPIPSLLSIEIILLKQNLSFELMENEKLKL